MLFESCDKRQGVVKDNAIFGSYDRLFHYYYFIVRIFASYSDALHHLCIESCAFTGVKHERRNQE